MRAMLKILLMMVTVASVVVAKAAPDEQALTEGQKRGMLEYYMRRLDRDDLQCQPRIGYTFCSCIDVEVDLARMLADMPCTGKRPEQVDAVDRPIMTADDLEDVIRYYASRGIGDERQIVDVDLFAKIKSVAWKYARDIDLGGNAATMAWRAFREGCRIKLGFPLNEEYFNKYFDGNTDRVEIVGGLRPINDYHLSLNYYLNESIWDIEVPRSNRMFLNHDKDNDAMVMLPAFLSSVHDLDVIVIGGTQLPTTVDTFVAGLNNLVQVLSLPENQDKQVHLESAAFSNSSLYSTQLDILLRRVTSLGMNEREFVDLYKYLAAKVN